MKEKNFNYFYKIENLINGNFYYGVHGTDNLNDEYMGSGVRITRAIKKYKVENFKKENLLFFDTYEKALDYEAEYVTEELIADPSCYNLNIGGNGGWYYINESGAGKRGGAIANINLSRRLKDDRNFYEFYKNQISEGLKKHFEVYPSSWVGRKHKEETKKKIGLKNSIHQQGEKNSNYGKCWIYKEDLKINKTIKKEELDLYLKQGWIKGRKMKF